MRKQIPNLITCMNVISGTLAIFLAMYGLLTAAAILILMGMVFDFFDGMTARLLHVKSEIGKEPVSYTHLDVYKRQMPMKSAAWWKNTTIWWISWMKVLCSWQNRKERVPGVKWRGRLLMKLKIR